MSASTDVPAVAWIAGVGASAGLGAALARRFALGGLAVALTGRSAERVEALAQEIRDAGGRADAVVADLANPDEVLRAAGEVQGLGALRAAIFNAGGAVRGGVLEVSPQLFEQTWRGSTFAAFGFAREAVRLLLANAADAQPGGGRGSLLFTGATASLRGGARFIAFAAAKAGVRSLAQSLARDLGPQGIHVAHVVIDGGIDGERLRGMAPERAAAAGPDGLLSPQAIADTYWQLHMQHRSAWTLELDLRPYKEAF